MNRERICTLTAYENGPLIVRGHFDLLDGDKNPRELSRDVIALCRCGRSGIKPLCDGSHKRIGFRAAGFTGPKPRVEHALEAPSAAVASAETGR